MTSSDLFLTGYTDYEQMEHGNQVATADLSSSTCLW